MISGSALVSTIATVGILSRRRFVDRVLLPGCIDHDERIGQLRHFQNAVEVSTEFGALRD